LRNVAILVVVVRNVTDGLRVNEKIVQKTLQEYLPFSATENLLMEAVKKGGDRQELHEIIRKCSMEATERMKNGEECDLLARLAKEERFGLTAEEMAALLDPKLYTGRCGEQVEKYLEKVRPLLKDLEKQADNIEL
jgi:adenylosuccinate lyase